MFKSSLVGGGILKQDTLILCLPITSMTDDIHAPIARSRLGQSAGNSAVRLLLINRLQENATHWFTTVGDGGTTGAWRLFRLCLLLIMV